MQVEVSQNWITAGVVIGTLVFTAVGTFMKLYAKSREDERTSVSSTPVVAANAIGAAFVDRQTAQDITGIREDVRALRKMSEDRKEHDDEDRVRRLAEEAAARVLERKQHDKP